MSNKIKTIFFVVFFCILFNNLIIRLSNSTEPGLCILNENGVIDEDNAISLKFKLDQDSTGVKQINLYNQNSNNDINVSLHKTNHYGISGFSDNLIKSNKSFIIEKKKIQTLQITYSPELHKNKNESQDILVIYQDQFNNKILIRILLSIDERIDEDEYVSGHNSQIISEKKDDEKQTIITEKIKAQDNQELKSTSQQTATTTTTTTNNNGTFSQKNTGICICYTKKKKNRFKI